MTQQDEQAAIWLTQDAFDKLTAELEDMKGPQRAEIVARISAARDEGDLKENGGYHAAREEQAKLEGAIRSLEEKLRRAQIGQPEDDGTVSPGMKVTVLLVDYDEEETFLLGAREMMSAGEDLTVYSPQSPLGSAIIGAKAGETVSYEVNEKPQSVKVLSMEVYAG
jgi:transcription elongation factor GreA